MKAKTTEEAKDNLKFALSDMQRFIKGYLYIGGQWIPAISETEAFQPLASLGSSNDHISDAPYKEFPNNKSMSDMLERPTDFHEWTNKNLK